MLAVHRAAGTYQRQVDVYIAPASLLAASSSTGGLPGDRIVVKPNFVSPDPGTGEGRGGYALFAGRLSEEKGIGTLDAGLATSLVTSRCKLPVTDRSKKVSGLRTSDR